MDEQDTTEPQVHDGPDDGDSRLTLAERVHVDLPRVLPEDMVTSHDVDPPPDPTGGRDVDAEFFIRHIG
ncbi:MAG: hypothetical protein ACRCY9_20005 [Phycicoccus sp.]